MNSLFIFHFASAQNQNVVLKEVSNIRGSFSFPVAKFFWTFLEGLARSGARPHAPGRFAQPFVGKEKNLGVLGLQNEMK